MRRLLPLALLSMLPMSASANDCPALLNHQFKTLQGQTLNLCTYRNQPILVVNTASKCGYTPQFEKLEGMYRKYQSRGLLVVGFPSNDFNQEPNTDKEIGSFCKQTYGVEFPMVSKRSVRGPQANAFYKGLIKASGESPQWNFHKYVITPGGKTVHSFLTPVEPDDPSIVQLIQPFLKKP